MEKKSENWKDLMINGSLILYNRRSIIEKEIKKIEAEGFDVFRFECAEWDEASFHKDISSILEFPDYYGENLNAFSDCLSDLEPTNKGILFVFYQYESFIAKHPAMAIDIMEIIHINSWRFLLEGKVLLGFIQSNDPEIPFPAIGGMVPQWNGEEWFDKERLL